MFTKQLADTLQNLPAPGNFYSTGSMEIFPPSLSVNKIGRIAFPLLPVQMEQLIEISEQAPYGKGSETLVDTDVRRTWQINADQVDIGGKYWQKNLNTIVKQVKSGLGVDCEVSAELYKLLVYDTGSFFVSHRDTEKADGMFATLIIVLPSLYSGGELLVRHQHEEAQLDLSNPDAETISFAAFYADCVHEVLPVTDGCRLTLIYNLIRSNKKIPLPTPPNYFQYQQQAATILKHWQQSQNEKNTEDNTPEKFIFLLEHAYSIAELNFDALKNKDAAAAHVLIAAAKQADCNLYLALVSIEESGSAEYYGYSDYNRWDEDDENDYEIGEVFEHSETISEWRNIDGSKPALPILPFSEEEFCPPESFAEMQPNDIEFQEATGNAGASFERMYHCAALVLWPKTQYLSIINQAGLPAALPVLKDLCQQWKNDKQQSTKDDAQTLATYLLRDWFPDHCTDSNHYGKIQFTTEFINCLNRLGNTKLLNKFWLIIANKGIYKKEDGRALAKASALLPWDDIVGYSQKAITLSANKAQSACVALLASLCNDRDSADNQQLYSAAQILFHALPGDSKRFPDLPSWQQQRMALEADEITDILVCFSQIDTDLAEQTLDYMLAWPEMYDMDKLLLPAALLAAESPDKNNLSIIQRLRQLVITHLQTRLAESLEPPADWSRENTVDCSCTDCRALAQFLVNPDQAQWRFKAAQGRRTHVESSIYQYKSDVDYVTEKKGSPHILVCTKNQASYQRRVKQSKSDQDALACLGIYN